MEQEFSALSKKLDEALDTIQTQGKAIEAQDKLIKSLQKQLAKKKEDQPTPEPMAVKPTTPKDVFKVNDVKYTFTVPHFMIPGPNGAIKVLSTDALLDDSLLEKLVSTGSKAIKVVA